MKKIIVCFITLFVGALSIYFYSAINERRAARIVGEKITAEKKVAASAKSPSGLMQTPSTLITKTEVFVPDGEETEKTSEDSLHKEDSVIKAEGRLEASPAVEEVKEKGQQPATFTSEASALEIKRKEEVKHEDKDKDRSAANQELIIREETSGKTEQITAVVPVIEETIKPADKPYIIREEIKAAIPQEEIKQPMPKTASAAGETRVVEERSKTIHTSELIIMPEETPPPGSIGLLVGMKNNRPDGSEKQPLIRETDVAVSHTEKVAKIEKIISPAEKTEGDMENPELFPGEMLNKDIKRIAIFPFENLSDNKDAFRNVLPLLIDKLEKRGFEVVDNEDLNAFLCKERVRSTGYISQELSGKIRKRFNVSAILTGAIITFSAEEIPEFGILARLIDTSDGTIRWADYYAATGEDFIAILELGRLKTVFSLIPKVIDILFASFKAEDLNREIRPLHRIAVMPFKNNTDFDNAGIIATYMFIVEMLKSQQFLPIEYGNTRDAIIKLGIRRKGDIGYENIGELSKELKARGILVGVVDNYSEDIAGSMTPNVGITARLVDGSNKKILWYNSYQLSGEENIIALDWGRIRSVHSVAYKAVSGLVKEMSKKKWRD